jgi:2-polyprenyl-6-methoxyphenol hydroxylase-like FAD-dependent oxidoreductase
MRTREPIDVLVVGGGPVGASLAIELSLRGIDVVVAERYTYSHRQRGNIRGRGLSVRSMEHLRRWGIADSLRDQVTVPTQWSRDMIIKTELAGPELVRFGRNIYAGGAELSPEAGLGIPQHILTVALQQRADEAGADVLLGWQVVELEPDPDGVNATLLEVTSGATRHVRAKYTVGCDGGRSLVRETAGIEREESEPLGKNLSVSLYFPDAFDQLDIEPAANFMVFNENGSTLFCPYNAQEWGYAIGPVPLDTDFGALDLEAETRRRIGTDARFTVLWSSPYPIQKRVAKTYRADRLFLAGDAAHLFPPYLGQNMNTGIEDAVNLGWKLAAAVQGWSGALLLDTYSSERRPVGWRNAGASVDTSRAMGRGVKFLRDAGIPRGDSAADAARRAELGHELYAITHREWNSFGIVLDQRYDASPTTVGDDSVAPDWDQTTYPALAKPGHRAPHLWLEPGIALYDRLGQDFTLLDLGAATDQVEPIAKAAADLGVPLSVLRLGSAEARDQYQAALVLVRPDQHVAWRSSAAPSDAVALIDAIRGAAGAA